jgi:Xaa-Pro dipeptidase
VICLETPYYRLGSFGLQVEDTFVVTDVGAERLTIAPRKLVEIPVGSPNQ